MTKNTLAAALMAALFAILAGWVWLAIALWAVLLLDLAQDIIEARRKCGEGNHDAQ